MRGFMPAFSPTLLPLDNVYFLHYNLCHVYTNGILQTALEK